MECMQEVDAMPSDGVVQHLGTPAIERRRKQYATLRTAWEIIFPADPLNQAAMSTWLTMAAKSAPGMEGEMVLDAMDCFYRAPHNGPIRTPRAAFSTALMNDLDPEGKAERRAKKDATRTEYKKAKKAATPDTPPDPADALRKRATAVGMDYDKMLAGLDGNARLVEGLIKGREERDS